jgi:CelD/BcsL family acetyltransferase involved in cellulose biosynthesis
MPNKAINIAPFETINPCARGWERLEGSGHLPTQSYMFVSALACSMLEGDPLDIFMVGAPDNIAALLPLCRSQSRFPRLRSIGSREIFEPNDALYVSPEAAEQLARAIAAQPHPIVLERVPATSLLLPAIQSAMKNRGLVSLRPALSCPTISLNTSWQNPEEKYNAGRRSDFRRAQRRADAMGNVRLEILSPSPQDFDILFDEALAVEARSWKSLAGSAMAVDQEKQQFFRQYFRAACTKGIFRLAIMRIDERMVAMQMALISGDRYWLFKIGYDEAFGKCSPGNLLMLHTLRYAANAHLISYELLGNIEPWITDFWTSEAHEMVTLRTYPFNLSGLAALANDGEAWVRHRMKPNKA